MPTYRYKCKSCGAEREAVKSIHASSEPEFCAERGCRDGEGKELQMVKQIGAAPFHLKGGGWYRDGYQKR